MVDNVKNFRCAQVTAPTTRAVRSCLLYDLPAHMVIDSTVFQVPNILAEGGFCPCFSIIEITIVLIYSQLQGVLGEANVPLLVSIVQPGDLSLVDNTGCLA